jgi:hypothetical protein
VVTSSFTEWVLTTWFKKFFAWMMAPLPGAPGAAHLFLGGLKLPDSKNIHFYPPCSWYLALNTGVSFCYNRVDNTMLGMSVPGG